MRNLRLHLVMPALNEAECLPTVLEALTSLPITFADIIVVDNASSDRTAQLGRERGVTVLYEPTKGYGSACLRAVSFLSASMKNEESVEDAVIFMDADFGDFPDDLPLMVSALASSGAELVLGNAVSAAGTAQQPAGPELIGNIALSYIRLRYGIRYSGIGRYRAITWQALKHLKMNDRCWGWPLEMQLKAAHCGLPFKEIPVRRRERPFPRETGALPWKVALLRSFALVRTLISFIFLQDKPAHFRRMQGEGLRRQANR